MKIHVLDSQLVVERIETNKTAQEMRKMIDDGDVIIIRCPFDKAKIIEQRRAIHQWGLETPESNPQNSIDATFHRIDNNHPKMSVKRIAHFYRFSYLNRPRFADLFDFIRPMNYLRNEIAGLPLDYSFTKTEDGYISQPAVLHYPRGGGYMEAHQDPVEPQRVEMVMMMSKRGIDYEYGGLSIKSHELTKEMIKMAAVDSSEANDIDPWVDIEINAGIGDLILFRPNIPHQVSPIDNNRKRVDWTSEHGRWILFSPIAHVVDKTKNEQPIDPLRTMPA